MGQRSIDNYNDGVNNVRCRRLSQRSRDMEKLQSRSDPFQLQHDVSYCSQKKDAFQYGCVVVLNILDKGNDIPNWSF